MQALRESRNSTHPPDGKNVKAHYYLTSPYIAEAPGQPWYAGQQSNDYGQEPMGKVAADAGRDHVAADRHELQYAQLMLGRWDWTVDDEILIEREPTVHRGDPMRAGEK